VSDRKKIPTSRLRRLLSVAGTTARTGASFLTGLDGETAARKAAESLGQLRGIAAKVGQMASYVDGVIPEDQSGHYEHWMKRLRDNAPSSSPLAIREMVETQLGASISELFSTWDDEPVASASIGQVHRATLPDGRPVAVKVQHPGIAEAMENDLKSAGLIESALGVMGGLRKFNSQNILEEVRTRFREELDYTLEADRQRLFAELFSEDAHIHIPETIMSHCARRVLTSEWVEGLSFDAACASAVDQRKQWAETLWHFVYKSNLIGGLFNADPHPGNYFFRPDGGVIFLDFGCVQPLTEGSLTYARPMHWAARHRDLDGFDEAGRRLLQLRGGAYEPRALEYVRACFQPLSEAPFHMTRDYVVDLVNTMKTLFKDFRRGDDDGYVPLPDGLFFVNRLQFGFYSVLARLDVEADYAAVERRFLTEEVVFGRPDDSPD
jgi:predicted unusual protein kinase regulating ubiquinone biosynthesis (AarF/ABC1/UbiB family)